MLKHPEFEQYYPDLADKVKFYEPQDKKQEEFVTITDNGFYEIFIHVLPSGRAFSRIPQIKSSLLHETQHILQGREYFSKY